MNKHRFFQKRRRIHRVWVFYPKETAFPPTKVISSPTRRLSKEKNPSLKKDNIFKATEAAVKN